MMNTLNTNQATRLGAYTALGGSLCALIGVGFWVASGTDIDASLTDNDMSGYLVAAGENVSLLTTNLTFWIIMVFLMGIAATAMISLCERQKLTAQIAAYCYSLGIPLVISSYVAWLAIVVQLSSNTLPEAITVAEVVGWYASRADWIATILVLGIGPTLISIAGHRDWVPNWLYRWGFLTAMGGILNAVALLTGGSGLATYGFLIIPIGVGWMIAAGFVLLRRIEKA
jgi:hypothetical protein